MTLLNSCPVCYGRYLKYDLVEMKGYCKQCGSQFEIAEFSEDRYLDSLDASSCKTYPRFY